MIRLLDFRWLRGSVFGPLLKERVCERTANALMKQDEERTDANAFVCEAVRVGPTHSFQEPVRLELAQIIPKLSHGILFGVEAERRENGLVDRRRPPARDLRS